VIPRSGVLLLEVCTIQVHREDLVSSQLSLGEIRLM
jgi:hypothetical protein